MKLFQIIAPFLTIAILANQYLQAEDSKIVFIDKMIQIPQDFRDVNIDGIPFNVAIKNESSINKKTSSVDSTIDFIVKLDDKTIWNQKLDREYVVKLRNLNKIETTELSQTTYIEHEGWTAYSRFIVDQRKKSIRTWSILLRGGSKDLKKFDDVQIISEVINHKILKIDGVSGIIVYLGEITIE